MPIALRAGIVAAVTLLSTVAWSQTCTIRQTPIDHSPNYIPPPVQTVFLDTTAYPHALCNDGTPGAYSIRPGFGLGLKRWVIYLHGGGSCTNQATCAPRYNTSKSSSKFWAKTGVGFSPGIGSDQATDNPDFYDANAVGVGYCSSDDYTGGTDGNQSYPPTDVRSWHFQGRAIVEAVIADLVANHGLAAGQQVLFGGGSSGGLGMFSIANDIVAAVPKHVRVLVSSDAGYAINAQAFDANAPGGVSTAVPTPSEQQIAEGNALWKGRGDLLCTQQAKTYEQQLACYSPPVVAQGGYLPPMFVQQSEIDGEQAALDGLSRADSQTTVGQEYLNGYFGPLMNASLSAVNSQISTYSAYDGQHVKLSLPVFTTDSATFPNGETLTPAQALGNWYRFPCPGTPLIQPVPAN